MIEISMFGGSVSEPGCGESSVVEANRIGLMKLFQEQSMGTRLNTVNMKEMKQMASIRVVSWIESASCFRGGFFYIDYQNFNLYNYAILHAGQLLYRKTIKRIGRK
jgi:hypothetical protein